MVCIIVQKQYIFSKLCFFVELRYTAENLLQKISCQSCIVWSRNIAKNFEHYSISAGDFFKDPRKFACFRTFWGKWACLIMKTLKIVNFIHIDSPYCGPPIRVAHSAHCTGASSMGNRVGCAYKPVKHVGASHR